MHIFQTFKMPSLPMILVKVQFRAPELYKESNLRRISRLSSLNWHTFITLTFHFDVEFSSVNMTTSARTPSLMTGVLILTSQMRVQIIRYDASQVGCTRPLSQSYIAMHTLISCQLVLARCLNGWQELAKSHGTSSVRKNLLHYCFHLCLSE